MLLWFEQDNNFFVPTFSLCLSFSWACYQYIKVTRDVGVCSPSWYNWIFCCWQIISQRSCCSSSWVSYPRGQCMCRYTLPWEDHFASRFEQKHVCEIKTYCCGVWEYQSFLSTLLLSSLVINVFLVFLIPTSFLFFFFSFFLYLICSYKSMRHLVC